MKIDGNNDGFEASPMKPGWTTTIPKENGWYWLRSACGHTRIVQVVAAWNNQVMIHDSEGVRREPPLDPTIADMAKEWYGPLAPPTDET